MSDMEKLVLIKVKNKLNEIRKVLDRDIIRYNEDGDKIISIKNHFNNWLEKAINSENFVEEVDNKYKSIFKELK